MNKPCFQRMVQLLGREIIILNGVAWPIYFGIFEAFDLPQCFVLDIIWKRRTKAIEIIFLGVPAFGFHEKLVTVLS